MAHKITTPNILQTPCDATPEMFFDYLAVHNNGEKAADAKTVLNFDFGEDGGTYKVSLKMVFSIIPLV